MDQTALWIGYAVIWVSTVLAALVVIVSLCALLWVYRPCHVRFTRKLPTHWQTPYGRLDLDLLAGLASRGGYEQKRGWFFGLIWLSEPKEDAA